MSEVESRLQLVFKKVFKQSIISVDRSTTSDDVKGWDSLGHIQLILAIEREFGLRFKSTEVLQLTNTGDLIDLIILKLQNNQPN
jgi:acyl carrier protein